jgi:acylphosphatase
MIARRVVIRGRVQGVGYRDAMVDAAERYGVAGWVRNGAGGDVEALVQGAPEAIEWLLSWCWRGPRLARVTAVEAVEAEADPSLRGFRRRPTA